MENTENTQPDAMPEMNRADKTEALIALDNEAIDVIEKLATYAKHLADMGIWTPHLLEAALIVGATKYAVSHLADTLLNEVANELGVNTVPLAPPVDISQMN